ncbi:MAG: hypothetical protein K0U68_07030 [Gammaproteobacteria bacterium]|nr:hypothetical protein [Gammaproteobacteria bacterium]
MTVTDSNRNHCMQTINVDIAMHQRFKHARQRHNQSIPKHHFIYPTVEIV